MFERQRTLIHLLTLFVVAVGLRLLYLKLASDNLGFEQFARFTPDSRLYLGLADDILSWNNDGGWRLLRVGPGYGLILAGIKFIFGSNLIWPIMFSIIVGGGAPVFVYLLAFQLFHSRPIALFAGWFGVVSLTSVSLSCSLLTDQPFFTMHASALVCFIQGCQTGRVKWYVLAGLLAGYAAYIRPIGQFWPVIFILLIFVIPPNRQYRSRIHFVSRASITGLIMLVMILGWSARNKVNHDLFVFGTNGMLTVRQCLVAQVAAATRGENKSILDYRTEWISQDGDFDSSPNVYPQAYNKAKTRVVNEFKTNPRKMLRFYFKNFTDNMIVENNFVAAQIPQTREFMYILNKSVKKCLGYLIIVLTLASFVLMLIKGHLMAVWMLGSTYLFFSVVLGSSFWQGSRLHYPAEMAWSIAVAYIVVLLFRRLMAIRSEQRF